jgi:DNA repair protein SbcC/Rad50
MRILAIRGCNLASLAGEFEVDLAHGPLGTAGVFAIVGPTGAGKSTLLDAMCVALFDRTPRLTNHSRVVVGRGDDDPTALGAQDVRSLLRRGASAGWAEVDFESGDNRQYRARWSVRRARNASDGRFQNQQVTLTAIEGGEAIGGTKTETLEAIHQRLGLSFDQFRRSALLAQGEFAAFLRADGKDRSELLERMTGTEIYSKLSIAAHVKAALAEQRLRERHGAALAIAVLSDDERAQADADLAVAKQAQTATRARFVAADAAARWLAEAERRTRALDTAEVARGEAERAVEAAAAERAELALRRRAEALRGPWEEAARLDRQLAVAQSEAAAASQAAERALAAQREIEAAHGELVALHVPIRDARISAGIVEAGVGPYKQLKPGQLFVVPDPIAAIAATTDAAWLRARRDLATCVAGWRELDAQLVQQAQLAAEIAASDKILADRARNKARLVAQRVAAVAAQQAAVARLNEAQAEASSYQQKKGLSLDAARRAEDAARLHCVEIEKLVAIAGEARSAATACSEFDRQLGELTLAAAADTAQRSEAEGARDRAATLRAERTRMLDELRKAAGYTHARAELVDGDPCPLCGATEHPWHDRGAFDALIGDAQAALADAAAASEHAVATLATLTAREAQRAADHARLVACRATAEASAAGAQRAWRAQLASLGELLLVDDPATPAAQQLAGERLDAVRAKLEAARGARSQAEAAAKAAGEAQARVQARQADVEHHVHALRDIDAALASVEAAVERSRGERAGKAERLRDLLAAIDGALARWHRALIDADPARAVLELARDALAMHAARRGSDSGPVHVGADAASLVPVVDAHTSSLLERCRRALAELATAWTDRAQRIAQLDAELAAAIAAREAAARDAERQLAETIARRDAATSRREIAFAELAEAASKLDGARIAAGFDRDELQRLLTDSAARAEQLAEHLDVLDRAADRARTLVAERRRLIEDHATSSPFITDADAQLRADAARLAELDAAVAAADHHAAALAATLAADTDARARRAAALAQHAAAEQAAEVDRVLGEVIGSHDGKLFRSFAQSLTLDGLLAVANSHLEELAPRYQLERVPKHDLELQVIDRDLGNEIRSVQSLSGGESFLVSLALALGLSSMSAHDVRVRTLLIDEGFGTLDPATLDSALAVLDALQATGRQVGVISHVPALVERVGAHVRVYPRGGGRSEVVVAEA